MGKVIWKGLQTADDLRNANGFVVSYGRVLNRGSAEHKAAVVEAEKKGDSKESRKLLANLPQ
jgi:hypothetical protein